METEIGLTNLLSWMIIMWKFDIGRGSMKHT